MLFKRLNLIIQVKLFATLAKYKPDAIAGVPFEVELSEGSTISCLMKQIKLPEKEVKLSFVNGRLQPGEYQLKKDDDVGIFPPIGGG
jgi:molybdopterin synthase sulfur carrier subunit